MASSRCRRAASIVASALGLALGSVTPVAGAATATGFASATVVREIGSVPIVIRFQRIVDDRPLPPAAPHASAGGENAAPPPEASFGIALIGVDADGVATFNVAGATTSSYLVQTSGPANFGTLDPAGPAGSYGAVASGQIFPLGTLTDGKDFAIAISQSLSGLRGELTVMVNYN
jgi:hypothetical protein